MGMAKVGGSLLTSPVRRLSQLVIDADKDWNQWGVYQLREVAVGMTKGDLITHDGTRIVKEQPGGIGNILYTAGPGASIYWTHP